jgi:preprotein translocase subunit SecY
MLIMWLGELISQRGLGNGISLIISAGYPLAAPSAVRSLFESGNILNMVILGVLAVLIIAGIVFVNEGQRRIPITYAKRQVGRRMSQGGTTYLAAEGEHGRGIPIIFASSLLIFPVILTQFAGNDPNSFWGRSRPSYAGERAVPCSVRSPRADVHVLLHGGAVQPGRARGQLEEERRVHPGYTSGAANGGLLEHRAHQITLFGAVFLAAIAVMPYFITAGLDLPNQIFLGGTSMLIVVGVSLDTVRQLESQLMMRNYEGFLKRRQR